MALRRLFFASLALLGVVSPLKANDLFDRLDAFEFNRIVSISNSPLFDNGGSDPDYFDIRDLFGGQFGTVEGVSADQPGVNNGQVVFVDSATPPVPDWVEWETAEGVYLQGYRVSLYRDSNTPSRETTRIKFYVQLPFGESFILKDDFVPNYDVPANRPLGISPGLSENTRMLSTPIVAKKFKMEFFRNTTLNNGQRIAEIDAIAPRNPEAPKVAITNLNFNPVFVVGETVPVGMTASDPQGIERVELYVDGQLMDYHGTNYNLNWTYTWSGTHTISARAIDKRGGESAVVREIQVVDQLPDFEISEPRFAGGFIHIDVKGPTQGRKHVVFHSSDSGITLVPVKTNSLPSAIWTYSAPNPSPGTSIHFQSIPNTR